MARDLSLAEIFELGYYWETKILLTAVKLDLFSHLDGRGRSGADLAARLQVDTRALTLLLNALVAMRVLTKVDETFANTPVAQAHLVKSAPQYIGHLLVLHDAEWDNWGRLEETIRTGRSPVSQHVFSDNPELGANVLAVLHRIGQQSGPSLAKRLTLDHSRTMLDLGGGAGTNAIAFCQTYPGLTATVFDLPETLRLTERVVKEAGLESRIQLMAGDFNRDSLGGPYDLILMSDILHYQDYEANARLVGKTFSHLRSGGRLVIKDRFLDAAGTGPAWTTAFAVHILVNTPHGGCYKTSEAMAWMTRAGFGRVEELEPTAVVQGCRES